MARHRRGEQWELDDAVSVQPPSGDDVAVATADKLGSLRTGDYVKLRFRLRRPRPGTPPGERMWVRITGRDGEGYTGVLENQPQSIPGLDKGDDVRFGRQHVLSIWEPPSEEVPVAFVNRRLVAGRATTPPGVLCHDPYDEAQPPLPDGRRRSGWQLLVGDETEGQLDDPDAFVLVPLPELVQRYAPFAALVSRHERGRQYRWDAGAGAYIDQGAYQP
jgi:hypothetical protein